MLKKLIALGCVTVIACGVIAQTTQKSPVIYVPKKVGQSKQRTDGATRGGVEQPPPVVRVLAPLETALQSTDQPVLYWYIDKPTTYKVDVVITTPRGEEVFTQAYPKNSLTTGGLMKIDLSKSKTKLDPNKDYRLLVLVGVVPEDGAADIESSGMIRFEAPDAAAQKQIADAKGIAKASAYAQNGYFSDAIAALAEENSAEAKEALAGLLEQVKLKLDK